MPELPNPLMAVAARPEPHDVVWARFVAPLLDGTEGFMRTVPCPAGTRAVDLVPIGSIVSCYGPAETPTILAETGDAAVLVTTWPAATTAYVRAATPEALEKAVADLEARRPQSCEDVDEVEIDFWQVNRAPFTTARTIVAPGEEIARNYPPDVWTGFGALRDAEFTLDGGRIILWHGPPGTGKTTAIRARARAWKTRARTQVVLDPELIFGTSSHLMHVLLADDAGDDETMWRLLVIEDADELIRADAKARVGQALSRLLNLSDGILGQGIRVLVLITTNEPVGRLHPALIRPGRCLMETEFRRFERAEAERAFGRPLPASAT